ncbi:MAG: alanine racemase [Patescibacteria group bacterium]
MRLIDAIRKIRKSFSDYRPSIEVLISRTNLLHNLNEYKKHYPHFLFVPVLKSNAYGHSLVEVAQILDKEEKAFFVVDSLYEAMILRNKGVKSPLLIIGYTSPNNINTCKLSRVMFTVTSWDNTIKIFKSNFKNIKYFHVSAYVSRTKYLAFKQKIR